MQNSIYRFKFNSGVDLEEIDSILLFATMLSESIHSEAQVRLDTSWSLDVSNRMCEVNATARVGRDLARMFSELVTLEFGDRSFEVERVAAPGPVDACGS